MLYQNTSVRITSTTKKAMAPEGKNLSLFSVDSMIVGLNTEQIYL